MVLKAPSRYDSVGFPVFAMGWLGDPADGTSILAYSGGGGSSRTGVHNKICVVVNDDPAAITISSGFQLAFLLHMYTSPMTKRSHLLVVLSLGKNSDGSLLQRYSLPDCQLEGELKTEQAVSAIAVDNTAEILALGTENGCVEMHDLDDEVFGMGADTNQPPRFVFTEHTEAICAVNFCLRGNFIVSGAKDGRALIWNPDDGAVHAELKCTVDDPSQQDQPKGNKKPARKPRGPPQILVRGCFFGDLEGKVVYTIACPRRGRAFLSRWSLTDKGFAEADRFPIAETPISAASLSSDGALLVMGATNGQVILWGTESWSELRRFSEVHGLPATCVAARPYRTQLQGENDGVQVHARSGSADCMIASLTLQTRVPKQVQYAAGKEAPGCMDWLHRLIAIAVLAAIFYPVSQEVNQVCAYAWEKPGSGLREFATCVWEEALVAPDTYPGISSPLY